MILHYKVDDPYQTKVHSNSFAELCSVSRHAGTCQGITELMMYWFAHYVQAAVWYCQNNYCMLWRWHYVFLADRLHAEGRWAHEVTLYCMLHESIASGLECVCLLPHIMWCRKWVIPSISWRSTLFFQDSSRWAHEVTLHCMLGLTSGLECMCLLNK